MYAKAVQINYMIITVVKYTNFSGFMISTLTIPYFQVTSFYPELPHLIILSFFGYSFNCQCSTPDGG